MALIDEILPTFDKRELHSRRVGGGASPGEARTPGGAGTPGEAGAPGEGGAPGEAGAVWAAVREVSGGELRLMAGLMRVRSLGRRPFEAGPVLDAFRKMGFAEVAEEPGRQLVLAGVGRFWRPDGGLRRVQGRDWFTGFDEPGYAKVAFDFRFDAATRTLSTETRIAGTDARAARIFGLYWLAVRPGSGLIRREWLRAIERRAAPG
jgi:hypothetical protein